MLSRFDLRIARLIGVRMVVTDAPNIPGGTLVYRTKAGNSDLGIFRLDGINVGQYSPVHTQRISTAAEAFSALRSPDFDPERNVIVERDIEKNLQPAFSATVTVDFGPTHSIVVKFLSTIARAEFPAYTGSMARADN